MANDVSAATIRPILKSELLAIYQLEKTVFGEHCYPDFFFRQGFDCWPEQFLVALEDDVPLGYILCAQASSSDTMWILSIAVSDLARGKGVGKRLIAQCLSQMPASITCVKLTVDPNNPAYALYQRLGFVDSSFEDDYFGENQARVVMSRILG
ncbi:GNAT family N-acetyltransferase [Shewanella acanthi]|uniref:GNAT family N-acetyltransferase n=1 Tax=Shewanella acanthi TaxID=2864212 RepID=UPI001C661D6A|nr:GNAT family N-acetyltransferase [Shewanella acanthi]QYJ78993.1 GNAT family N-acetyltransferase [Shewanella acanthi]